MTVLLTDLPIEMLAAECTAECAETNDCAFCLEPVACEHVKVLAGLESTATACQGAAHEECHREHCSQRECWVDTDAGWYALHEW